MEKENKFNQKNLTVKTAGFCKKGHVIISTIQEIILSIRMIAKWIGIPLIFWNDYMVRQSLVPAVIYAILIYFLLIIVPTGIVRRILTKIQEDLEKGFE